MPTRLLKCLTIMSVLMLLTVSTAHALNFPLQGARSQGMGGAGVAEIGDENASTWNPANYQIRKGSFDVGIHGGAQLQTTRDIQKELQDIEDFDENVAPISDIDNWSFSDTQQYSNFVRLTSELRDTTRKGQGVLGNLMVGANGRKGSWGIIANNHTSFSLYSNLTLNEALVGQSDRVDSSTVREFVAGDTSNNISVGNRSLTRFNESTTNSISRTLNRSLEDRGLDITDLGFDPNVTEDSVANEVAFRIEQYDPGGDTVTDKNLRQASDVLFPNLVNLADTDSSDSATEFDTTDQNAVARGVSITEVGLTYSRPTKLTSFFGGDLYGGMNLKYMQGEVGYVEQNIFEGSDEDEFDDNIETTSNFGVDVGLMYDHMEDHGYRIGLVGRNINGPEFDYPDAADTAGLDQFEVDPQFRLGFSGYPLRMIPTDSLGQDWWRLSVDYDLTTTGTTLKGYDNQYLAIGNEFNVFNRPWLNMAFRAGLRDNLAQSSEGTVYTGGIGLKLAYVNIDVAGNISDKTVKDEDGDERPTVLGGGFNISVRY